LFTAARKPVLAVGLGAVRSGARETILAVAERFGLPIVLTPMAKGMVPEDHPCYAGVLFHALSDRVGETHQQADLVVAVGYDPVELNLEAWMPDVPLVNLDTVPADVDVSEYDLAADVVGSIGASLDHLLASAPRTTAGAADEEANQAKDWDLQALAGRRRRMFEQLSADGQSSGPGQPAPAGKGMDPRTALDILRDVLADEGIMTGDVGAHLHLIGQKWRTPRPLAQLMTNGWSSMGYAVPAAIAAKRCRPDLPVCAVAGDGGFLMTAGELAVAVRERLAIVFVLFADSELALIRIKQERKGNPVYGTPVGDANTTGRLFGVPLKKTDNATDFEAALRQGFAANGPTIVEAMIDASVYDELVLHDDRGSSS
jgi:acetolactate synthase-1/2/3 large subunit